MWTIPVLPVVVVVNVVAVLRSFVCNFVNLKLEKSLLLLMLPLFRTQLFFPLRYFRRNSPRSVFLCTRSARSVFVFIAKGLLFLHLHFVDFWVTQGSNDGDRTASNNKNKVEEAEAEVTD